MALRPLEGGPWDPWAALRRSGARLRWVAWSSDGPTGLSGWKGDDRRYDFVAISANLSPDRIERTLTHELVHLERRVGTVGGAEVDEDEAAVEEVIVEAITEARMAARAEVLATAER